MQLVVLCVFWGTVYSEVSWLLMGQVQGIYTVVLKNNQHNVQYKRTISLYSHMLGIKSKLLLKKSLYMPESCFFYFWFLSISMKR